MSDAMLRTDSIGKRFGRRRVLSSASVSVEPGRVTALFGRNGCGKTTLLRIINGFERADHGNIWFDGRLLRTPALHALAEAGMFFVPDRDLLSRVRTVGEHVELLLARFPNPDAGAILGEMGIYELLDRTADRLSGGEIRRSEFALAMLRRPRCLMADEPFLGIAPRDADRIAGAIRSLASRGCAILITGHEVETILATADTIVWMTAGTTHELGPPGRARQHDQFRREYLGPRGSVHPGR